MDYSGIADKGKFKVEKKRIWGETLRLTDTIRVTGSALPVMGYKPYCSVSRGRVCSKPLHPHLELEEFPPQRKIKPSNRSSSPCHRW